jgi:hypothetical protein
MSDLEEFYKLPEWLQRLYEQDPENASLADETIKALEEENRKLREDAAQVFIEELVINGGGMDASLSCQPFTRIMAQWALECFKAQSEGDGRPNFVSMEFGLAGQERYTMTVQRASGNSPEKMAGLYRQALAAFEKWWRLPNDQRTIEAIEPAMSRCLDLLEGKV